MAALLHCPALNADLVYKDINMKTCASLLKLVEREREGELVDRALIKNILGIFIEVSEWSDTIEQCRTSFMNTILTVDGCDL